MVKIYSSDMGRLIRSRNYSNRAQYRELIFSGPPHQSVEESIEVLYADKNRGLIFNGKKGGFESDEALLAFLGEKDKDGRTFVAVQNRYVQDLRSISGALLLDCANQSTDFMPGFPLTSDNTSGSIFHLDNDSSRFGVSGILYGAQFKTNRFETKAIPGELMVRSKSRSEGGVKVRSSRASNALLEAILAYKPEPNYDDTYDSTPNGARRSDGNGTYIYPKLVVYGLEIIQTSGRVNFQNFDEAIKRAQAEEDEASNSFEIFKNSFSEYSSVCVNEEKKKNLQLIQLLTEAHRIKEEAAFPEDQINDADDVNASSMLNGHQSPVQDETCLLAATLDTTMATIIFRDLPLVLGGQKDIENCPALIDAIVWCGDPELSAAIKQALHLVIEKNPEKFEQLLVVYGSGDSTADLAQAYLDAVESEDEALIEQSAQRFLNATLNSSQQVSEECQFIPNQKDAAHTIALGDEISLAKVVESKTSEEKFTAALNLKIALGKVESDEAYKNSRHEEHLLQVAVQEILNKYADSKETSIAPLMKMLGDIQDKGFSEFNFEQLDKFYRILPLFERYCDSSIAIARDEDAYKKLLALNELIVNHFYPTALGKQIQEDDSILNQMDALRAETRNAVENKVITPKLAAQTLHQVNSELINCVTYLAGPKNEGFKPVTESQTWSKIGNEAMKKAASPVKKWASRILMGVGVILAVGFGAALGAAVLVGTGGLAAAALPVVAVGTAVASVVSPGIAAAAVGAVAAAAVGAGVGLDRWLRSDVKACGETVKKFEKGVDGLVEDVRKRADKPKAEVCPDQQQSSDSLPDEPVADARGFIITEDATKLGSSEDEDELLLSTQDKAQVRLSPNPYILLPHPAVTGGGNTGEIELRPEIELSV